MNSARRIDPMDDKLFGFSRLVLSIEARLSGLSFFFDLRRSTRD